MHAMKQLRFDVTLLPHVQDLVFFPDAHTVKSRGVFARRSRRCYGQDSVLALAQGYVEGVQVRLVLGAKLQARAAASRKGPRTYGRGRRAGRCLPCLGAHAVSCHVYTSISPMPSFFGVWNSLILDAQISMHVT